MEKLDPELKTYYMQVKDEVKKEHGAYISGHPEIRQLLNDFLSTVLLEKPEDVYAYAQDYFSFFNTEKEPVTYKPLVISGPSGVGKGTLVQMLIKHFPDLFELSISYTTRKPRPDEKHGVHYFFVTPEEFTAEVTKHSFIESTQVHGNMYGTHKGEVKRIMEKSKICIIEIDINGAEKISKSGVDCSYIWIDPPSLSVLRDRLKGRGTEKEEAVNLRMQNAENEMKKAKMGNLYEKFLVNGQVDETFKRLLGGISDIYELNLEQ